jgi:protein-histidine pros-kinase
VDALPDAVVVVDDAGTVRYANARAEAFFGSLRHQLLGCPAGDLVPGLDQAVKQLLVAGATDERLELSARRPPAGEHPVEVWLARVAVGPGQMAAVTVRDDREGRLLREASARMRDELFASVSHELRTPLTSIIGYTELLVDMGEQALSEQAARLISVIERNAERELRLVEDLLTLASLGASGGLTVQPAPTALAPIADAVVHAHAAAAAEAGVELRSAATGDVWVRGDAPRIEQVLRNLVGNAIKFTPAGGQVTVAISTDEGHGVLAIEDQGVGVAPDELPLLFEGLFRGDHAVSAHLPGAGLGLPIVKGIVDAHGGEIDVESERGEGTRVVVRLPLAEHVAGSAPQNSRLDGSSRPRSAS